MEREVTASGLERVFCLECGHECSREGREREVWTVLTADGRILSFRNVEEIGTAVLVGLIGEDDSLLSASGPSQPVRDVPELRALVRTVSDRRTDPYDHRTGVPGSAFGYVKPIRGLRVVWTPRGLFGDSCELPLEEPATVPAPDSSRKAGSPAQQGEQPNLGSTRDAQWPEHIRDGLPRYNGNDLESAIRISLELEHKASGPASLFEAVGPQRLLTLRPVASTDGARRPSRAPLSRTVPRPFGRSSVAQDPLASTFRNPVSSPLTHAIRTVAETPRPTSPEGAVSEPAPGSVAPHAIDSPATPLVESSPAPRSRRGWVALGLASAAALALLWTLGERTAAPVRANARAVAAPATSLVSPSFQRALLDLDWSTAEHLIRSGGGDSTPGRFELQRAALSNERADARALELWAERAAGTPPSRQRLDDFASVASLARWQAHDTQRFQEARAQGALLEINALRMLGQLDLARRLLAELPLSSEPELTYVQAMLALSSDDERPKAQAVADLKLVADNLQGGARGRAALTLALLLQGDLDQARVELGKLRLLARPHPALAALDRLAASLSAKPAPRAARHSQEPARMVAGKPTAKSAAVLAKATQALRTGRFEDAERLYRALLRMRPLDCDALTGLGEVALARRDFERAREYAARAISIDQGYVASWLLEADVEWAADRRNLAARKYSLLRSEFPESDHPSRVEERSRFAQ